MKKSKSIMIESYDHNSYQEIMVDDFLKKTKKVWEGVKMGALLFLFLLSLSLTVVCAVNVENNSDCFYLVVVFSLTTIFFMLCLTSDRLFK